MPAPLRVGIIGATPQRGWGTLAHLPALAALEQFTVTAVATTRAETARATAAAHQIPRWFDDNAALIGCPDVDVVAVTVKVTEHAPLVAAALAAGKHVFCEWPLGTSAEQAAGLAELAAASPAAAVTGLQGWHSPGARYVAGLLGKGLLGTPLAVSAVAAGRQGGQVIPAASAYGADAAAGASVLSITTGHLLATLSQATGPLQSVSAEVAALTPAATVAETGQQIPVTAPDQVVLAGRLASGAALSVAVQGSAAARAHWELRIVGSDGTLLARPDPGGASVHVADWEIWLLRGAGPPQQLAVPVPQQVAGVPAGPARNVALVYAELAAAIEAGRAPEPGFAAAADLHRLLAAIARASATGTRQQVMS